MKKLINQWHFQSQLGVDFFSQWSTSRINLSYTFTAHYANYAADRPARRRGLAHAKYSVSHHMVTKPFLLLGLAAEYRSRRLVWLRVVDNHLKFMTFTWRTKLTAH